MEGEWNGEEESRMSGMGEGWNGEEESGGEWNLEFRFLDLAIITALMNICKYQAPTYACIHHSNAYIHTPE